MTVSLNFRSFITTHTSRWGFTINGLDKNVIFIDELPTISMKKKHQQKKLHSKSFVISEQRILRTQMMRDETTFFFLEVSVFFRPLFFSNRIAHCVVLMRYRIDFYKY